MLVVATNRVVVELQTCEFSKSTQKTRYSGRIDSRLMRFWTHHDQTNGFSYLVGEWMGWWVYNREWLSLGCPMGAPFGMWGGLSVKFILVDNPGLRKWCWVYGALSLFEGGYAKLKFEDVGVGVLGSGGV